MKIVDSSSTRTAHRADPTDPRAGDRFTTTSSRSARGRAGARGHRSSISSLSTSRSTRTTQRAVPAVVPQERVEEEDTMQDMCSRSPSARATYRCCFEYIARGRRLARTTARAPARAVTHGSAYNHTDAVDGAVRRRRTAARRDRVIGGAATPAQGVWRARPRQRTSPPSPRIGLLLAILLHVVRSVRHRRHEELHSRFDQHVRRVSFVEAATLVVAGVVTLLLAHAATYFHLPGGDGVVVRRRPSATR